MTTGVSLLANKDSEEEQEVKPKTVIL